MDLKKHYESMWVQALEKYRKREFEFDPFINADNAPRYGLTLVAKPPSFLKEKITELLEEIKVIAPNQYYYPGSDLHITILTLISCYPGFSVEQINLSKYVDLIHSAIKSITPFQIHFRGMTASPSCILIQGFPGDQQLHLTRNALRNTFKKSDLEHSIDKRYIRETAHMTAIRFKQPLRNGDLFVRKITELRNRAFGSCMVEELELVGTNWYHQKEKTQNIHTFNLSG